MLVQFTVENFLSFQTAATLTMAALERDATHPRHVVPIRGVVPAAVRAAGIHGASGAGKTNLLRALAYVQAMVLDGSGDAAPHGPFRPIANAPSPTRIEIIFRRAGQTYSCGWLLGATGIMEEWLYRESGDRDTLVFGRRRDEDGSLSLESRGAARRSAQLLKRIADDAPPEVPLLARLSGAGIAEAQAAIDWFRESLLVVLQGDSVADAESYLAANRGIVEFAADLLRRCDPAVVDVVCRRLPVSAVPGLAALSAAHALPITSALRAGEGASLTTPDGRRHVAALSSTGELQAITVEVVRRAADGLRERFRVEEECRSVQWLVRMAPVLYDVANTREAVVCIDGYGEELDQRMARAVLDRLLHQAEGADGQILFTTRDRGLLDLAYLRRDEIWFLDKGPDGDSRLSALIDALQPDAAHPAGHETRAGAYAAPARAGS